MCLWRRKRFQEPVQYFSQQNLAGEGTRGDNLILTNHIACTEAPSPNNITSPFVVDWLLLAFAFLIPVQLAVRQREGVHAGKREDPLPAPVDLRKMLVHSPLHSPAVMDVSVQLVLYPEQSPLFHQGAGNRSNSARLCRTCIEKGRQQWFYDGSRGAVFLSLKEHTDAQSSIMHRGVGGGPHVSVNGSMCMCQWQSAEHHSESAYSMYRHVLAAPG